MLNLLNLIFRENFPSRDQEINESVLIQSNRDSTMQYEAWSGPLDCVKLDNNGR